MEVSDSMSSALDSSANDTANSTSFCNDKSCADISINESSGVDFDASDTNAIIKAAGDSFENDALDDKCSSGSSMEIQQTPSIFAMMAESAKTSCSESIDDSSMNVSESNTVGDEGNVSTKFKLYDMPCLSVNKLTKDFVLDEYDIEVTSLDITAHGFFVMAGCGNGMVLLYDMTSQEMRGIVVGHIQAKGLHTNLLLQVQITDDCRFCFAGVQKGSSEMLAIDIGRLIPAGAMKKSSNSSNSNSNNNNNNNYNPHDWITTHSYSDAKLRGFCASTRYVSSSVSNLYTPNSKNEFNPMTQPMKYRLACGRGIKNVHVWQFEPDVFTKQKDGSMTRTPEWSCIYDVASNGNTIESISFRDYGNQVISKSAGVVLRFWDLKKANDAGEQSNSKPGYEDIPNSADVKRVFDKYSFGGTYEFAVVNISAPKIANRDSYEMPERTTEDENGQRRRRMMRQIEDVVGTSDGQHVLALCTDGGVMYFNRNEENQSPEIMEFGTTRDPDVDSGWAIKRVGTAGEVVLLRAIKSSKKTTLRVNPLVENMTSESRLKFPSTGLRSAVSERHRVPMCYYFEVSKDKEFSLVDDLPCVASVEEPVVSHTLSVEKKASSRNRKSASSASDSKTSTSSLAASVVDNAEWEPSIRGSNSRSLSAPTPDKKETDSFITPAHFVASSSIHNKVTPSDIVDRFATMDPSMSPILKRKRVRSSATSKDKSVVETAVAASPPTATQAVATCDIEPPSSKKVARDKDPASISFSSTLPDVFADSMSHLKAAYQQKKPMLSMEMISPSIGPPPRVARVFESNEVIPLPELSSFTKNIWNSYQTIKTSFMNKQKLVSTSDEAVFSYNQARSGIPLGVISLQQLSVISHEQITLKSRFLYDMERTVAFHAAENIIALEKCIESSSSSRGLLKFLPRLSNESSAAIIARYRVAAHELVKEQQLGMNVAWDMDCFYSNPNKRVRCPAVIFQFGSLFDSAAAFLDEVKIMFCSIDKLSNPADDVASNSALGSDSMKTSDSDSLLDISTISDRAMVCS